MLIQHSCNRRLLACVVACGMCLTTAGLTQASDCGCEVACESCSTTVSACSCGCQSKKKKHNCLYKALDMFAGGIEKMLKLDQCGCNTGCCDGGCDTAMGYEMHHAPHVQHHPHHAHGVPAPGHTQPGHTQPGHTQPGHTHSHIPHHSGAAPSNPMSNRQIQLAPVGPSQWPSQTPAPEMSEPSIEVTPKDGQHLGKGTLQRSRSNAVPPPVRMPQREMKSPARPRPQAEPDRGSLFDTLTDPFSDDEAKVKRYRSIRPTTYLDNAPRPVSRRPLP